MTPQQGEFQLPLDGTVYTFFLGTGALIALQEHLRTVDGPLAPTLEDIVDQCRRQRVLYVRGVLWASLRRHHDDITLAGVEGLLDRATPDEVKALLGKLFGTTQPDAKDLAALRPTPAAPDGGTGRQARKRAAKTGGATSTWPPAAAV